MVGALLAGCSSTGSGSTGTQASASVTVVRVAITGKQVTPTPGDVTVAPGSTVRLVVTSDHDDELHAHGFDVEAPLKAGVPTTIRLTGKEAGSYEVETHEPALTLLTVAVR